MPDLKMSSFIAQNAQTLTNLSTVASKFSEKLYQAETFTEVSRLTPLITESSQKQLSAVNDMLNAGKYQLDDNGSAQIGGKSIEDWAGGSTEWYNTQLNLIKAAKTPDARRQLQAALEQTASNLRTKIRDTFDNKRIEAVDAEVDTTLLELLNSSKPLDQQLFEAENAINGAIATGVKARNKAMLQLKAFKQQAISQYHVRQLREGAKNVLAEKGYTAALNYIYDNSGTKTYGDTSVQITDDQMSAAIATVNMFQNAKEQDNGDKMFAIYIDAQRKKNDPNFKPEIEFDLDSIAKYGNGNTLWTNLYKAMTEETDRVATEKAYLNAHQSAVAGKLSETDYNAFINNEKNPLDLRVNVVNAYQNQKGNRAITTASVLLNNLRDVAAGRVPMDKTGEPNAPQVLTTKWITDNQDVLGGDAIRLYGAAVDDLLKQIESSTTLTMRKNIMTELVRGTYKSAQDVINAVPKNEDAGPYLSLYWQTTDRNKENAQESAGRDVSQSLVALEEKLRKRTLTEDDIASARLDLDGKAGVLGGYYSTLSGTLQKLAWGLSDQTQGNTVNALRQQINQSKGLFTESSIWNANIDAASKSQLYNEYLQVSGRANEESATREVIKRYANNERLKRGETLAAGETILDETFLANTNIPVEVVRSFTDQLSRDATENYTTDKFKSAYTLAKEGKLTEKDAKGLPLNQWATVMQMQDQTVTNNALGEVNARILNLSKNLNGQEYEGPILTEAWLKTQPPEVQARGYAAIGASVDFFATKNKSAAALAAYKKVVDGKATGQSILEDTTIDPATAMSLYSMWRQDTKINEADEQEANADKLYWGFMAAQKKARGETLTKDEQASYDSYGSKELVKGTKVTQAVRNSFYSAYDSLDVTTQTTGYSNRVADIVKDSVDGKYDKEKADALYNELQANRIVPYDTLASFMNRVTTAKANAQAVLDDRAQRERMEEEQAYTDGQRTENAQLDTEKANAAVLVKGIINTLSTASAQEFENARTAINAAFRDPTNALAYIHQIDLLEAGKQDKNILARDKRAQDAFDELKRSKTVTGYTANGDVLSLDLIKKLFGGETEAELKMRQYYTNQLEAFNKSIDDMELGRAEALTELSKAKFNLFATLTKIGYDPEATVLDLDMIARLEPKLRPGEGEQWRQDLTNYGETVIAMQTRATNAENNLGPTKAQKEKAAQAMSILTLMAQGLARLNKDVTAPTSIMVPGVDSPIQLSPEQFNSMFSRYGVDIVLGGLSLADADKLRDLFKKDSGDDRWASTQETLKLMFPSKDGKVIPPEFQAWVNSFRASSPSATPEQISKFNAELKRKVKDFQMSGDFRLTLNAPDASENYLNRAKAGEFRMHMGMRDGVPTSVSPLFNDYFEKFAANELKAITDTFGAFYNYNIGKGQMERENHADGTVSYIVKDANILKKLGVGSDTKSVRFYMEIYDGDALVFMEKDRGQTSDVQVFIPWENDTKGKNGRWISVNYLTDGSVAKTRAQVEADTKKKPEVTQYKNDASIREVQNYPAFN